MACGAGPPVKHVHGVMMSTLLDDLIQSRIEKGYCKPADFRGCSDAEIDTLEERVNMKLPGLFKDYLRRMGWSAGEMLQGSDVRFGCLHLLTGEGREELGLSGVDLPQDAFVFFAHQGYDYMYFLVSDDDDPAVYRYHIDWDGPRQVFRAFSGYLRWMFGSSTEIPPAGIEEGWG